MSSSSDDEVPHFSPPPQVPFINPSSAVIDTQFMQLAMKQYEELMSDDFDNMYLQLKHQYTEEGSSSRRPKRKQVHRGREEADGRLWNDYFAPNPIYDERFFRRRFRMHRHLFNQIVDDLKNNYSYFTQRVDAVGRIGLSPHQKCTCAIRMLAYGMAADQTDEYIRIGESTALECLQRFCRGIIELYSKKYLRRPNESDIQQLLDSHSSKHGFPGMLGSIDCMHWAWKNCPVAWKGQYTRGDHGHPTIMLEAVASQDLWIWHAYFGVAGSNNDINVINQSPIFNEILDGGAPQCNFIVNGTEYNMGYYLADGIYPEWATLVKSFKYPQSPKMLEFKARHESARKDVERAFGVLQARWHIIQGPTKIWSRKIISDIMYTCIILHNMIVEDEGDAITDWSDDEGEEPEPANHGPTVDFEEHLARFRNIRNNEAHHALRNDLMEHIWSIKQ